MNCWMNKWTGELTRQLSLVFFGLFWRTKNDINEHHNVISDVSFFRLQISNTGKISVHLFWKALIMKMGSYELCTVGIRIWLHTDRRYGSIIWHHSRIEREIGIESTGQWEAVSDEGLGESVSERWRKRGGERRQAGEKFTSTAGWSRKSCNLSEARKQKQMSHVSPSLIPSLYPSSSLLFPSPSFSRWVGSIFFFLPHSFVLSPLIRFFLLPPPHCAHSASTPSLFFSHDVLSGLTSAQARL